jgi:hypothetical protein
MSKFQKLLDRFSSKPKDFTYNELRSLLNGLGYSEIRKGKTSGSRVAFVHPGTNHIMRLHKPHSNNELKMYQVSLIYQELKDQGVIE